MMDDARRNENYEHAKRHNEVNKMMDEQQKELKAQQVAAYKEQLDSQVRIKNAYRAAGNMTGVEKALNRDDMLAYKKYDSKNYSMVPGMPPKA